MHDNKLVDEKALISIEGVQGVVFRTNQLQLFHDPYRIDYLKAHIEQMQEAITDGVDLVAYTPWGCIEFGKCFYRGNEKALWIHLCRC